MRQAERENDTAFIEEHKAKFVQSMPEAYQLYVTAYIRLDGEREYTRPIPWSAIVAYCAFYGLSTEQTEWAVEVLERVDRVIREARFKEVNKGGKS